MSFLTRAFVVLISVFCHASVESFANTNSGSFRLQTLRFTSHPTAIKEIIFTQSAEGDVMNLQKEKVCDIDPYPIFSLPKKKSLKSKRKAFMENARSLVVFTSFLLKSTFVQPAHAALRSSMGTRTQIESERQFQGDQVSLNRKIVPISLGVATALGGASLIKKGKKGDTGYQSEKLNSMLDGDLISKDKISDSMTSKAKELIRKADQLEEDVIAKESELDNLESFDRNESTDSVSSNVELDEKRILAAKRLTERIKEETRKAAEEEARKKEEMDRLQLEEKLVEQMHVEDVQEEEEEIEAVEEQEQQLQEEDQQEDQQDELETVIVSEDAQAPDAHDLEVDSDQEGITTEKSKMKEEQDNQVDGLDSKELLLVEADDTTEREPEPQSNNDTENMAQPETQYDYSAISDPSERAFRLLVNLGMVNEHPDPDSPDYDHSDDDEVAVENNILLK